MACTTTVATVIADETSFYTWLQGNKSCPSTAAVYAAVRNTYTGSGSNPANTIYQQETLISSLSTQLEKRTLDVKIAQDRATMTVRPEMMTSYYDSWFPLNRPLKHISVPIIIGFSTLLLTMSLLLLLELVGIRILFSVLVPTNELFNSAKFTKPFWAMAFIAIGLAALTIYLFMR